MNIKFKQMVLTTIVFAGLLSSCKKSETVGYSESAEIAIDSSAITADSVSMAATQNIKDKQFIKTANVNMEVKNVYESTISIKNYLKQNGGFVTNSNLRSNINSEDSYDISSEKAMLVKKYTVENQMQVRVPTEKLGAFLQFIHQQNLFLNHRIISAEDVTANISNCCTTPFFRK